MLRKTSRSRALGAKPRAEKAAPPPRARLDVDERRAQLLSLALGAFSERSYDEVSIDDIARAASVSKGLLFHYFPSKRDLYVAALGQAARQLLEETTTAPTGTPEERLRRGLDTYVDFVERHRKAYSALVAGGVGSDPKVAALLEETRSTFAARLLAHIPDVQPGPLLQAALRGWVGFVEAASLDWVMRREGRREDLVDLLAAVLFDVVARVAALPAR